MCRARSHPSSFPPLLSYLRSLEEQFSIIYQTKNKGPRNILEDEDYHRLLPEYFCLTDPDLAFNANLPADFVVQLIGLTELHKVGKAGFSLDVSEIEKLRQNDFLIREKRYKIWEWEAQFWLDRLADLSGNPVYKAAIDTTFAVYNKKFFRREIQMDAVRVAGQFTCRHLPWYNDTRLPAEEKSKHTMRRRTNFRSILAVSIASAVDHAIRHRSASPNTRVLKFASSSRTKRFADR